MWITRSIRRMLCNIMLILYAMLVSSCTATKALHNVLTGRRDLVPPRVAIPGPGMRLFSPNETGWYYGPESPEEFNIVKPGRVEGETFAFQVALMAIEPGKTKEQLIADARLEEADPSPRFQNLKIEVTEYPKGPGGNCFLRHGVMEDHSPVGLEKRGPMILEAYSFICVHPQEKRMGVFLNYSQRYFPGGRDASLMEKASASLQTLEFNNNWGR